MKSLLLALLLTPVMASAAPIKIASVSASSSYPKQEGVSYEARQLIDNKQASSWVEGDSGSGLGSWVELDLGGEHEVASVNIWGGLWYSKEYWNRANRPKEVEFSFSDGSKEKHSLGDEMGVQVITLSRPVKTSSVKLTIKQIHAGSTWADTAISEIKVFDTTTGPYVAVTSYDASSMLPVDADGTYEPSNMTDGIIDSMWCEADKAGDGVGEWVEFTFGGKQKISTLHLVNGIGGSMLVWMKGNRATKATLSFDGGASEQIAIKASFMPQNISFPAHETRKVKITFDAVVKGKEYNDLCLSEALFK